MFTYGGWREESFSAVMCYFWLQSMLKGNLRRSFTLFDLIMIGTGLVVGSGVLIVTGEVQGQIAGYVGWHGLGVCVQA